MLVRLLHGSLAQMKTMFYLSEQKHLHNYKSIVSFTWAEIIPAIKLRLVQDILELLQMDLLLRQLALIESAIEYIGTLTQLQTQQSEKT